MYHTNVVEAYIDLRIKVDGLGTIDQRGQRRQKHGHSAKHKRVLKLHMYARRSRD